MLDRRGDWFQLPRRPFPRAAWLRLPNARVSTFEEGRIYKLAEPVSAQRQDTGGIEALSGNIVVLAITGRRLAIRKEQPAYTRGC